MAELLLINGVELERGIKVPNVKAYAGDILWVETENALYTDVFVGLLLGLLKPKKGKLKFITSDLSYCDVMEWIPPLQTGASLCRAYAYSRGVQASFSINNFNKFLRGTNAEYLLDMDVKDMAKSSKVLVSWAISMSVPSLNVILNDPYYGLDKRGVGFLSAEIENAAKDGSLVIILSQDRPAVFNQHVQFTIGGDR